MVWQEVYPGTGLEEVEAVLSWTCPEDLSEYSKYHPGFQMFPELAEQPP